MRKFLNIVAKVFATLLAILFVVTAVVALLLFNLERKLFNSQTYKQALANQRFYERMPAIVAQALTSSAASLNPCEQNPIACGAPERSSEGNACFEDALGADVYQEISSNRRVPTKEELSLADACLHRYGLDQAFEAGGPPAFMSNLGAEDWEFIIASLLPPEDLKTLTGQGLDSVMSFFNGKTDSAVLSLAPLKARLAGEDGVELVMRMMEAQPGCTDAQMTEMGLAMLTAEPKITMCNPSDELESVIKPLVQGSLESVAAELPDQATLIPQPGSEEADPRGGLTTIRLAMRLSPLIALLLLLGITLFAVRSLKEWLTWWGIPLALVGIILALVGLVGSPVLKLFVQNKMLQSASAQLPAIVIDSGIDLVAAVIDQLVKPIVWQGILLVVLGVGMLAFAFYRSRRDELQVQKNSEPQTSV